MKHAMLVLLLIASANARADADPEIDDPAQIKAFLSDPRVNDFNYPEPKHWKNYRRYIQIGTILPNGACQFHDEAAAQSNQPVLKIEAAVDRAGCRSLMMEGSPDPVSWRNFQQFRDDLHKQAKSTVLSTPGVGRTLVIRKDPVTQVPQLQLNESAPLDSSVPAAASPAER